MKALKNLNDIANLHDLRSIPRTRRSAKPQLPTTAILDLCMARNERDRLAKERQKLSKRKMQIGKRLQEIEGEMDGLLKNARKKAEEIRGLVSVPVDVNIIKKEKRGKPKMVLEY